jgi:hypothetical protein
MSRRQPTVYPIRPEGLLLAPPGGKPTFLGTYSPPRPYLYALRCMSSPT